MPFRSLFITALSICALILGVVYLYAQRDLGASYPPVNHHSIATLKRICTSKREMQGRYEHYSQVALDANDTTLYRLMRALSASEGTHLRECAYVIGKLGGEYITPPDPHSELIKADYIISSSLNSEIQQRDLRYDLSIPQAIDEGNGYVARIMAWVCGCDTRHYRLLQLWDLNPTYEYIYLVCPTCGNTYTEDLCDPYCPHCMTCAERFERFD